MLDVFALMQQDIMPNSIKDFPEQFSYNPTIENRNALKKYEKFVVVGMGGSHLAADVLKCVHPKLDCIIHSDYGFPELSPREYKERLIILSSYSGNTEEVIDAFETAQKTNYACAVIASGGELLKRAQKSRVPYIQLPNTGIQPRMALGFSFIALCALIGKNSHDISSLSSSLKQKNTEIEGKILAKKLKGYIPIVYASSNYTAAAKIWKIVFNETAKIPAFYNVIPELNHNEMTGFDRTNTTKNLSEKFSFIFLRNKNSDSILIKKRMEITARLLKKRGFLVMYSEIAGKNTLHKIFSSILIANWTAYYLGKMYGVETNEVPMVEEFKKFMKK